MIESIPLLNINIDLEQSNRLAYPTMLYQIKG